MTPDEIKRFIEANFPEISTADRSNPDGWSFWDRQVRRGQHSTRIARALDDGHRGTRFKLSVTSTIAPRKRRHSGTVAARAMPAPVPQTDLTGLPLTCQV